MISRTLARVSIASLLSVSLMAGSGIAQEKHDKSLYDRLGGKPAITAVVDEFVARVAADARINAFFARADIPHLKMELVDEICQAAGGPCKYTGRSMKDAHKGMGIGTGDFNALVEDLVGALDKFHVGKTEKDQLLGVLGPMQKDIVEKK